MPIYEYLCRGCGTSFEKRLKFEERLARQTCPACQTQNASLLMSAPARVSAGAPAAEASAVCPSTGSPCGCGRGGHHH